MSTMHACAITGVVEACAKLTLSKFQKEESVRNPLHPPSRSHINFELVFNLKIIHQQVKHLPEII